MKYKSLLTHLVFAPVGFLCAMASAVDAQPACRSIINPSPGSVCYTEWQFSSRQRDEGGTRTHEQLVERIDPKYVIVDTQVIVQEANGTTSRPTPNVVSSSGNISIINQTDSSIRELSEVKNSLQAKAEGCKPPVCGQIQNQLDIVNQKISEYSERKRVAIEAGGNEKILFKWTTAVRCSMFGVCGGGAWMNGVIRVYQRYLGNPSEIRQETLSLVNSSQAFTGPSVGYFDNGVTGFYSNGTSHCGFLSPKHSEFFRQVNPAPSLGRQDPSNFGTGSGACSLPSGYFDNGVVVFFSTGNGAYCGFLKQEAFDAHKRSRPQLPNFGRIDIEPNRIMTDTGVCQ
jgi:hypothetical protein